MKRIIQGGTMEKRKGRVESLLDVGIIDERMYRLDVMDYFRGREIVGKWGMGVRVAGNKKPMVLRTYVCGGSVDMFDILEPSELLMRGVVFDEWSRKVKYDKGCVTGLELEHRVWWREHGKEYLKSIKQKNDEGIKD